MHATSLGQLTSFACEFLFRGNIWEEQERQVLNGPALHVFQGASADHGRLRLTGIPTAINY